MSRFELTCRTISAFSTLCRAVRRPLQWASVSRGDCIALLISPYEGHPKDFQFAVLTGGRFVSFIAICIWIV